MTAYVFGEFVFAPGSGRLSAPHGSLELRRKTARLLVAFLEQPQRLLHKAELFAQVWPDTAVVENVLAQGVRELRVALRDDARRPRFLRTRSARGYEWLVPVERLDAPREPIEDVLPRRAPGRVLSRARSTPPVDMLR